MDYVCLTILVSCISYNSQVFNYIETDSGERITKGENGVRSITTNGLTYTVKYRNGRTRTFSFDTIADFG